MVQVHVLAREWGFDSPPGHQARAAHEAPAEPLGAPASVGTGALLRASLGVSAVALAFGLVAFGVWRLYRWMS